MAFKLLPTSLLNLVLLEPQVFWDERGFFMETYSQSEFQKIGIINTWVQDNHSRSKKWALRGLHFQTRKPQAKLVRVTAGAVYDVVVDLRKNSLTFGQWEGFFLSAENKHILYIPRGFAHGFLTLQDDTEFLYKCDDLYDPGYESGIIWNDPTLAVDWHDWQKKYDIWKCIVSTKDQKNAPLQDIRDISYLF